VVGPGNGVAGQQRKSSVLADRPLEPASSKCLRALRIHLRVTVCTTGTAAECREFSISVGDRDTNQLRGRAARRR